MHWHGWTLTCCLIAPIGLLILPVCWKPILSFSLMLRHDGLEGTGPQSWNVQVSRASRSCCIAVRRILALRWLHVGIFGLLLVQDFTNTSWSATETLASLRPPLAMTALVTSR